MAVPAAYILPVPKARREVLLDKDRPYYFGREPYIAEPVDRFEHSRRAPLIVFCCFEDEAITHIADGRKGASAGTGLVRLNLTSLEPLAKPVKFQTVLSRVPGRVRRHLQNALYGGGILPPKTLGAVIDSMLELEPSLSKRLERFSRRRAELVKRLSKEARSNLAVQKETLATALELAGIDSEEVLDWSPETASRISFLEGMPNVTLREDAILISDFSTVPGFQEIQNYRFVAKAFETENRPDQSRTRLTVIMANRLPLEQQTGADLIYFNETFRSFVMVQYKAMSEGNNGPEFRWQERDQLHDEIERMAVLLEVLKEQPDDRTPSSFRLNANPFFLKLCPKLVFNPDEKGLSKGMYLPLDYWKSLAIDPATEGVRGGRLITYENVGRRLSNSQFVALVGSAWIGTTVPQSALLDRVIRSVIQTGKTVTLAVKSELPPSEADVDEDTDADIDEDTDLDEDSWREEDAN